MERNDFIKLLTTNKWWDNDYFYQFSNEVINKVDDEVFNKGLVMIVLKYPKNGSIAISSVYRVVENEDKSLTMYLNSKYGTLDIKQHLFTVTSEDGVIQTISQYIVL